METLLAVITVVNLLLALATLVFVIVRTRPGAAAGEGAAREVREELRGSTAELRQDMSAQRAELRQTVLEAQQRIETRVQQAGEAQAIELARDREARAASEREVRERQAQSATEINERLHRGQQAAQQAQAELKAAVGANFDELRKENEARLEGVRQTLAQQLDKLREGNEAKLEKMRETVDEKLQGTLEKRLGESFSQVSERLEQVQKGLGEMQTLASDVGGLKRVLTNVKNRGGWGEVQLERQLEDMLSPDQYEANVAITPGAAERVEFAVRLPGRGEYDSAVYLPIDSKFPQEAYERLLGAQEGGEKDQIDAAVREVERVILAEAKRITKYIAPPHSTDFAIMYLPTEGLFAEVARKPGLLSRLQSEHRVTVAGPTVFMSLLNSLQMGFRTLAIEKRSSEVWQVLSAAKFEFEKYGQVWDKLGKQLQTAQNTVSEAGRRTRAVERKLRDVESLDLATGDGQVLAQMFGDDEFESAEIGVAEAGSAEPAALDEE